MSKLIICQKKHCGQTFPTDKARKRHCDYEEDHDYCRKCDFLAEDWDDLTLHKATSPVVHLCCKFCGQDFKTISGRDRHIRQLHPVDQDLRCIGCHEHFVRAAALVEHLEFDYCTKISAQQFKSNIQHKNMVSKILENPEILGSKIFDFNVTDTDTTGGVALSETSGTNLLDEDTQSNANPLESEGGGSIMKPLVPDVKPRDLNGPRVGQRWPSLPTHSRDGSTTTDLSSSMAGISLAGSSGSRAPLYQGAPSDTYPTLSASTPSIPSSVSTEKPPKSGSATPNAWGGSSSASSVLFKGAKKTPITNEWDAALHAKDEEHERGNSNNLLWMRNWDPTHKDYNPERFYNPVIERYLCPLPQCSENFLEPFMLEHHISTIHAIAQLRCPQCLKLFKSVTALVAHCEAATSNCGISRSDRFGQAIDKFSGGFLGARDAHRPDFTEEDRKDRIGDDEKIMPGSGFKIGMIKYESTLPIDWPTNGFRDNVQIGRTWDEGGRGPNRIGHNINPAVPLSRSHKQHHSTKSIYPEPFKDFVPDIDPERAFAPSQEERNRRQNELTSRSMAQSEENVVPPSGQRKKKQQRRENMASLLIDSDRFKAVKKEQVDYEISEEPERVMTRDEAIYLADQKVAFSDAASMAGSSVAGSRKSAWK
ncbi:putative C2H2 finger domain protein [Neofusicoccum parvum]|uniref:C2H2 finger domain protein n=1 Tax=Neofusicoccum parvum TaxID=310453 RepID=A0ACB5S7L0_9PEZI|nr:putative C2H2 finger domain protein [Neofusicoccum parvum]